MDFTRGMGGVCNFELGLCKYWGINRRAYGIKNEYTIYRPLALGFMDNEKV